MQRKYATGYVIGHQLEVLDAAPTRSENRFIRLRAVSRTMRLIAHRGCADQYPENTIRAVTAAAPHVDAVEVDVRRCGSGEIVVFHNEDLRRVTGRRGMVAETPWDALRGMEVLGSGETVPLFRDLAAALPAGVGLTVELKHPGMGEEVVAVLDGIGNDALISSFLPGALAEVAGTGIPRALLFDRRPRRGLSIAARLDCALVHPSRRLLWHGVVERAHEAGFGVNVWTMKTGRQARAARDHGADGIVVDRWDLLRG